MVWHHFDHFTLYLPRVKYFKHHTCGVQHGKSVFVFQTSNKGDIWYTPIRQQPTYTLIELLTQIGT